MPTVKPDQKRMELLEAMYSSKFLGFGSWVVSLFFFSRKILNREKKQFNSEVFYKDQLANDWRAERLWTLAQKEGMLKHRFDTLMKDQKVFLAQTYIGSVEYV